MLSSLFSALYFWQRGKASQTGEFVKGVRLKASARLRALDSCWRKQLRANTDASWKPSLTEGERGYPHARTGWGAPPHGGQHRTREGLRRSRKTKTYRVWTLRYAPISHSKRHGEEETFGIRGTKRSGFKRNVTWICSIKQEMYVHETWEVEGEKLLLPRRDSTDVTKVLVQVRMREHKGTRLRGNPMTSGSS